MSSQETLLVTTGVATSFQADWLLGRPVWGSPCLLPPGTVFLVSGSWPHPTISLPPHKSPVTWSHPRHKVRRVPHHTPPRWGQRNRTVPGDTASDRRPAGVWSPEGTGDHRLGLTVHSGKCTHHARVRAVEAGHMDDRAREGAGHSPLLPRKLGGPGTLTLQR